MCSTLCTLNRCRTVRERNAVMLTATTTTTTRLASGALTTWAGTTGGTASARRVRSVWLPSWHAGPPTDASDTPALTLPDAADCAAGQHLRHALPGLAAHFLDALQPF